MKTTFRIKQPYCNQFLQCAREMPCESPARPERFLGKMAMNQGSLGVLTGFGLDCQGLERKNPVIVALGDSVTAGHFERLPAMADPDRALGAARRMKLVESLGPQGVEEAFLRGELPALPPVEITDARESYLEKFREMLLDQFELTSVSTINAGIAGDHLLSMIARADRDVVRYQPDLVLINGVLNWGLNLGTTAQYKEHLRGLVRKLQRETQADIVLVTPNGDLPNPPPPQGEGTPDRVQAVRQVAWEEGVCLADAYAVWERAREQGCPWEELLCNGSNHPSVEGHLVYAITLMKLCQDR
ncbi:MAG: SGNH/GDSL hydrolase family protein [Acutalibacter sp.]|jgi:acyl-CoA thioesterase-1